MVFGVTLELTELISCLFFFGAFVDTYKVIVLKGVSHLMSLSEGTAELLGTHVQLNLLPRTGESGHLTDFGLHWIKRSGLGVCGQCSSSTFYHPVFFINLSIEKMSNNGELWWVIFNSF